MILNVAPIGKPRLTQRDRWAKRPCVERYWAFKDDLTREAERNEYILSDVFKNVIFVVKMPKSWSEKKKKLMDGQPHMQRPDLDNMCKAFWDSLSTEDSNIHTIDNVRKVWGREACIKIN